MMASKMNLLVVLVGCLVLVSLPAATRALKIISVTNGETEGDWGVLSSCPGDSRVIGYQTENDMINAERYDQSGMSSIRLFCNDDQATNITSTRGKI